MIRIAEPQRIDLNYSEIDGLADSDAVRNYVFDNKSFYVDSTRLNNIELRITFVNGYERPDSLFVYYFQQIASLSVEPNSLVFNKDNPIIIRPKESEFWKNNPLYVDKIGFTTNRGGNKNFRFVVEAFKII